MDATGLMDLVRALAESKDVNPGVRSLCQQVRWGEGRERKCKLECCSMVEERIWGFFFRYAL